MLFGKKANSLKDEFKSYVEEFRKCMKGFEDFFYAWSQGICGEDLEDLERYVRHQESRCDTHRREIQKMLTTGAFMPDFRSDIFNLIENVDKVANKSEEIVVFVSIACFPIPEDIKEIFREILTLTVQCTKHLSEALDLLLDDLKAAMEEANLVEDVESEIDTLERRIFRSIFHNQEIRPGDKMLLKHFIEGVCDISDKSENASDRIELMAIKRKA